MSLFEFNAGLKFLLRFSGVLKMPKLHIQELNLKSILKKNRVYRTKIFNTNPESSKVILLMHGMSANGIDDLRIIDLARNLVAAGFIVVTPELEEVKQLRISAETVENIQDCYLSISKTLFPDKEIGYFSVSFCAGMGLVALSNPEIARNVSAIGIIGGFYNIRNMAVFAIDHFHIDDYAPFIIYYNFLGKADKYFERFNRIFYESALDNGMKRRNTSSAIAPKLIEKLAKRDKEVFQRIILDEKFRNDLKIGLDRVTFNISLKISPEFFVSNIKAKVSIIHGKDDYVIPEEESMRLKKHFEKDKIEFRHCITKLLSHGDRVSVMNQLQEIPLLANSFGYFFNHV